jgi:SUN domain-containing protein 1/2
VPNSFIPPSFYEVLGLPSPVGPPSDAITPGADLGSCFAFSTNKGTLGLHLPKRIKLKSVSLEHVDSRISPDVSSAPKHFTLFGFKNLRDAKKNVGRVNYGSFMYSLTEHGEETEEEAEDAGEEGGEANELGLEVGRFGNRQHFPAPDINAEIRVLVLQVDDNHGREDYTCLYRLRVFEDGDEEEGYDDTQMVDDYADAEVEEGEE